MKTMRTIIATLSAVLLTFALAAWFSVRQNAAFIQRTIYQGFDQTFVVALVMGCAFLLISIILTVAIASTDEDEADEEEPVRPKQRPRPQSAPQKKAADGKAEQPYRRVSRSAAMDQGKPPRKEREDGSVRPRPKGEEQSAAKKRVRAAEAPEDVAFRRHEAPVKPEKKAPKPVQSEEREEEPLEVPAAPQVKIEPEAEAEPERKIEPEAEAEPERKIEPEAETESEAEAEPERKTEPEAPLPEPEPAPGPEAEEPEAAVEGPAEPAPEPAREEGTVYCIFCGSPMSKDSPACPACGKKR